MSADRAGDGSEGGEQTARISRARLQANRARTRRLGPRHGRRPDSAVGATGRARGKESAERRTANEKCLALTCAIEAVWLTPNVGAKWTPTV